MSASDFETPGPEVETAGEPPPPPAPKTFASLGLGPEVLRALEDMGFSEPMEVQTATIPLVESGRDLMIQSRTGSGKTAAFGIPLVDRIVNPEDKFVQGIVLLPTRELALQVASEIARIAAHRPVTVVPVYGGAPMGRQIEQLRAGGQIVCGTPGRVLDHLRRRTLTLDKVRCVVLDECDEMLSMGFQEDIEDIVEQTPAERQTLLFSATVPEGIQRLSRRFLRDPEFVKLSADFVGVHEIRHVYYAIPGGNREAELLRVLDFENPERAIIFCNTREETGRVAEFLRRQGFESEAISSDLSQSDREKVMARMRAGGIRFLVATDVAARGIDLEALSHVINYTFPDSPEVYIHRTGRTGRAGRQGTAISLIGPSEVGPFYYVKLLYKIRPEERSLPSESEIRAKREGERILALRARYASDPGPGWRSLARRLMSAIDGERLCAAMLAQILEAAGPAKRTRPAPTTSIVAPSAEEDTAPRPRRPRDERGRRDRPSRDDRPRRGGPSGFGERTARPDRPEGGDRERSERPDRERGDRPDRERSERPDRGPGEDRPGDRPPRPPRAPEADFASVWGSEENPAPETASEGGERPIDPGAEARLFINLGRKDEATPEEVAELIASAGVEIPLHQIEVMNTHSYVNVPGDSAERLIDSLTGRDRRGRRLNCERARPRRR